MEGITGSFQRDSMLSVISESRLKSEGRERRGVSREVKALRRPRGVLT